MSNDRYQLHLGDCLEVLRTLPDGSVDAVITDPPYFRVKDEGWDRQWASEGEFLRWLGGVASEWKRVLAPNGSLYCFASPSMAAKAEVMLGQQFNVLNSIRWYKEAGWHKKAKVESLRSFLTPWEAIIFAEQRGDQYEEAARALHAEVYAPIGRHISTRRLAKGVERHEVDTACAPSRKPTGLCYRWEAGDCLPTEEQYMLFCRVCDDARSDEELRREYEELRREYEELRREYEELRRPFFGTRDTASTDMWTFPPVQAYAGKHPCEKPAAMLERMIATSTREGATVLDTFAGGGSTGIACIKTKRKFIGIEIEPKYYDIAKRRIDAEARQRTLDFGGGNEH